ncbi:hypothetical protein O1611_g9584 [Lasiodiplodia mahajangana]|uniref:Uncharacterized protein n=1 Tax=Lasiodiplodia mahajangana TaxID=1108764 RepID=A0ACC2J7T2_9PEZI|nr:hypothetical protein O1611_g9584 [Lasiodiplodia mahajangana]
MHHYGIFITFVITLSTLLIGASPTVIGANKDALSFRSPRNSDDLGSGIDPSIEEALRSPGNRNYLHQNNRDASSDDNSYPEDDDDSEYEFDPDSSIGIDVLPNNVSLSSGSRRVLHVKGISCSGLAASHNVTEAINEFVD